MIVYHNKCFLLRGENYAYMFRITEDGLPEHLHFGRPRVNLGDADALAAKNVLDYGNLVNYDEKRKSLETLPLEWGSVGRGDYRSPSLTLADEKGTDFRYAAHRFHKKTICMQGSLPQAHGLAETLEIHFGDSAAGLELILYYTPFDTALVRRAVLRNASDREICFTGLMSSCLDLIGNYRVTTLNGGWIAEARRADVPLTGGRFVNSSVTGFSSNRHNPGFLLSDPDASESAGRVYGFNLIYSGNHYACVEPTIQNITRVVQGINPDHFSKTLQPGECFEAPEAVLAFSDEGFGGLSRNMHRFVNEHIVPEAWAGRERPVLYNSWEGCMFDFNESKLLKLADKAKNLGCELFVLDDGWFGKRNNDLAGLGDYSVNRKKLPSGLKGLGDKLSKKGLDFGLWFEPEAVNPDSELYRAHPDWALTEEGRPDALGRHELLLDLTRAEVRDYIVEQLTQTLDSAPIRYVKWDMNRNSIARGLRAHEYILGLYEVLDRVFAARPDILLESCASGGNRFDLGMMCFSPQVWTSDDTDPVERMSIQENLSLLYPQSVMGAHVSASPHAQTLRHTPLSTRGNVSFFGILGYELDLEELLPAEEAEISAQIRYYKANRRLFQFGELMRLRCTLGHAWQLSLGDEHVLGLFYEQTPAVPGYEEVRLSGLDPEKRYRIQSRMQLFRVGNLGGLLKHVMPVKASSNGALVRKLDASYRMKDAQEVQEASGSALMQGFRPNLRFNGTGYHEGVRMQADFSSTLYRISAINTK